jgi:hypothetical protein
MSLDLEFIVEFGELFLSKYLESEGKNFTAASAVASPSTSASPAKKLKRDPEKKKEFRNVICLMLV